MRKANGLGITGLCFVFESVSRERVKLTMGPGGSGRTAVLFT